MLNVFIPSNLELEKFLQDNPPTFKYYPDKFRYIISLITEIPAFNKDILEKYKYVPIQAKKLQGKINNYKRYIEYLLEHKIFETDNHYIVDEECIGYRFTPQYRTTIKVETISYYTLVKSLEKKSKFEIGMNKKYAHLRRWFNDGLQIDYNAAMDYLCEQLKQNTEAGVENALLKFNANCVSAYRLKEHDFIFKVDDNVGRLHTNLTILKKELRNFLTYEGKPMVAVDYANSQPCLTSVLLDENFYTKPITGSTGATLSENIPSFNIHKICNANSKFYPFNTNSTIQDIQSYIMLVKNGESIDGKGFQPFIDIVSEGELYPCIQQEIKAKTGKNITNKKELKAVVFTALFTDNRFIAQPEAEPKRIFRDMFPEVYEVYTMVKKKDSTILPRVLQTIESKLMLDNVAKRIKNEHPEMTIYSIHDSISCTVGNEYYVARVMEEEMQKAIGIKPTVRFEYWRPENAYGKPDVMDMAKQPMYGSIAA